MQIPEIQRLAEEKLKSTGAMDSGRTLCDRRAVNKKEIYSITNDFLYHRTGNVIEGCSSNLCPDLPHKWIFSIKQFLVTRYII